MHFPHLALSRSADGAPYASPTHGLANRRPQRQTAGTHLVWHAMRTRRKAAPARSSSRPCPCPWRNTPQGRHAYIHIRGPSAAWWHDTRPRAWVRLPPLPCPPLSPHVGWNMRPVGGGWCQHVELNSYLLPRPRARADSSHAPQVHFSLPSWGAQSLSGVFFFVPCGKAPECKLPHLPSACHRRPAMPA